MGDTGEALVDTAAVLETASVGVELAKQFDELGDACAVLGVAPASMNPNCVFAWANSAYCELLAACMHHVAGRHANVGAASETTVAEHEAALDQAVSNLAALDVNSSA